MLGLIIVLLVLALLLIAAELFVVGGVLGALGVVLILVAAGVAFYAYQSIEIAIAILFVSLGLAAVIVIVGFRYLQRSRVGKHLFLSDTNSAKEGFESMDDTLEQYRGKLGVTVSELRPAGLAEFDDERITVTTEGGFLDEGISVEVVDIRYNQIVVRPQSE